MIRAAVMAAVVATPAWGGSLQTLICEGSDPYPGITVHRNGTLATGLRFSGGKYGSGTDVPIAMSMKDGKRTMLFPDALRYGFPAYMIVVDWEEPSIWIGPGAALRRMMSGAEGESDGNAGSTKLTECDLV